MSASKQPKPTPETDGMIEMATCTSGRKSEWVNSDFTRKLERERDEARTPICIGPPLIQILAKEGQWVSENGNGLVAADGLFGKDPYAEIAAMRELLREIRDDEVNAQDEADKFLRDHEPSELSRMREAIKEAKLVLDNALFVHQAITAYAPQDAVDRIENQKHCDNLKTAITKLKPFLP